MIVKAYKGQSIADVAVMYCGSVEAVFDIVEANRIATAGVIDWVFEHNQDIVVPEVSNAVVRQLKTEDAIVCTCLEDVQI